MLTGDERTKRGVRTARRGEACVAVAAVAVLLAGVVACSSPPDKADAPSRPATVAHTPSPPRDGRILTVSQDGSAMYSSLQKAADATQPGDTVVIAGGTYKETLVVPHDGADGKPITYRAADGQKVVVDGGGRLAKEDGLVTLHGRSFVTLAGITVTDSASHGVIAEGARHIELRDCTVANSSNGGVVFINGSDITITGCEVRGNNARGTAATHEAVSLQNVERFAVVNSVVHNNGEEGIDAKYGSRHGSIAATRCSPTGVRTSTSTLRATSRSPVTSCTARPRSPSPGSASRSRTWPSTP